MCSAVRAANKSEVEELEKKVDLGPKVEGAKVYTPDELNGMDLAQLRKYGATLGVAPARFEKTMVNRILAVYAKAKAQ
jgi:hypothetical protein